MSLSRRHLGLLAAGLTFLAGCQAHPAKPRLGEVDRLPHLETIYPRYSAEKVTVDLLATVEPFEKADLCSQVQGEVVGLKDDIDIDRPIRKGEVLVTLDVPALQAELNSKGAMWTQAINAKALAEKTEQVARREVTEAQAVVRRYRADVEFREFEYNRTRELVAKGTVQPQLEEESKRQRSSAQSAFEAAEAQVLTKQAKLEAAAADVKVAASKVKVAEADYKLAKAKVDFATIRAPFDGVIVRRMVDNGAVIKDPGTPLLSVVRTDKVRVLVDIPERYVPLVRASEGGSSNGRGNEVVLTLQAYGREWRPTTGRAPRITRLARALDGTTRLMRAEIHLDNPDHRLFPGMTGQATVILDDGNVKKLTIPSTAIVRVGDETRVYYIANPHGDPLRGEIRPLKVTLGLDNGKTVEVKTGLEGNELIIAKGNGTLGEGTAIAVDLRETKHQ